MFRPNPQASKVVKNINSGEYQPSGQRHEIITIPSSSAPLFGGYCVLDLKEKNIEIHDLMLQLNTSAITGMSGSDASFPCMSPAYFWFSRIEIAVNNVVMDTIFPDEQFIRHQLYYNNEDRRINNMSCGSYVSRPQR